MVFVFRDYELSFGASIGWEIARVYGIGFQRGAYIFDAIGISSNMPVSAMNYYFFDSGVFLFKYYFITDDRLRLMLKQRLTVFVEIKLRRGLRLLKGLSVRGQHTHRNCKTNKYHIRREI